MFWLILVPVKVEYKRTLPLRYLPRKPPNHPLHRNPKTRPKTNNLQLSITSGYLIILIIPPITLNKPIFSLIPDISNPTSIAIDIQSQNIVIVLMEFLNFFLFLVLFIFLFAVSFP